MKDIINCEYSSSNNDFLANENNYFIIIQALCEHGHLTIGDKVYPITYGGLYFMNGEAPLKIVSDNVQPFVQSSITLSKNFLVNLASTLDCTDVINDIFAKGNGFYVPIKHYKTIAARFKNMASLFKSEKPLAKALLVSELIPLFNYAMHAIARH